MGADPRFPGPPPGVSVVKHKSTLCFGGFRNLLWFRLFAVSVSGRRRRIGANSARFPNPEVSPRAASQPDGSTPFWPANAELAVLRDVFSVTE